MYDLDYFINKFEAINHDKWCAIVMTDTEGRHCALGHCENSDERGYQPLLVEGSERKALQDLTMGRLGSKSISFINDGFNPNFQQPNPKDRVLAALRAIKNEGNS